MDEQLNEYLQDLYRRGHEHDAEKADRLERLRNVEPDTARLLAVLVRALGAKRLLELGTSNGYSTLWLADAARSVGGRVLSVNVDPTRTAQAMEHLTHVRLQDYVELRTEDGALTLSHAPDASLDMIFLDAERPAYCDYWPNLLRVLAPGGLLVVQQRAFSRRRGAGVSSSRPRRGPSDRGGGARRCGCAAHRQGSVLVSRFKNSMAFPSACPRLRPAVDGPRTTAVRRPPASHSTTNSADPAAPSPATPRDIVALLI